MSALRMIAWGVIDVAKLEDRRPIVKEMRRELAEHHYQVGGAKQKYRNSPLVTHQLWGPPQLAVSPKGKKYSIRPWLCAGSLQHCCAHALRAIEPFNPATRTYEVTDDQAPSAA